MAVPGDVPVAVSTCEMVGPLPFVAPLTPDWTTVQVNVAELTLLVKAMDGAVLEHIVGAPGLAVTVAVG